MRFNIKLLVSDFAVASDKIEIDMKFNYQIPFDIRPGDDGNNDIMEDVKENIVGLFCEFFNSDQDDEGCEILFKEIVATKDENDQENASNFTWRRG